MEGLSVCLFIHLVLSLTYPSHKLKEPVQLVWKKMNK